VGLWVWKYCLFTKLSVHAWYEACLVYVCGCECECGCVGLWVFSIVCFYNCPSHTWYEACLVYVGVGAIVDL